MPIEHQSVMNRMKQIVIATRSKTGLWQESLKYHAGLFLYYYKAAALQIPEDLCCLAPCSLLGASSSWKPLEAGGHVLVCQQELRNDRYIIRFAWGLNNGTWLLLGRCDAFLNRQGENSPPSPLKLICCNHLQQHAAVIKPAWSPSMQPLRWHYENCQGGTTAKTARCWGTLVECIVEANNKVNDRHKHCCWSRNE